MKHHIASLTFAFLSMLPTQGLANAVMLRDTVGNAGDYVRIIFTKGHEQASRMVATVRPEQLERSIEARTLAWIYDNKDALAQDLRTMRLNFVEEPRDTCAYTLREPAAEVILSIASCRQNIKTPVEAATLLIHEATHHFGIDDEALSDSIAITIVKAWEQAVIAGDQGFRFVGQRQRCENAMGDIGLNPGFKGECGNFSSQDLSLMSFADAKMRGSDFSFADINNTSFAKASLRSAKFTAANLKDINFDDTNVTEADFSMAIINGSTFHQTMAHRASFKGAYVNGQFADPDRRQRSYAQFYQADFSGATLVGEFHGADFRLANFQGASIKAKLSESDLRGVNLKNANLTGASLAYLLMNDACLDGADLRGAWITSWHDSNGLAGALYTDRTKLDVEPSKLGLVKVDSCP